MRLSFGWPFIRFVKPPVVNTDLSVSAGSDLRDKLRETELGGHPARRDIDAALLSEIEDTMVTITDMLEAQIEAGESPMIYLTTDSAPWAYDGDEPTSPPIVTTTEFMFWLTDVVGYSNIANHRPPYVAFLKFWENQNITVIADVGFLKNFSTIKLETMG